VNIPFRYAIIWVAKYPQLSISPYF
jgi:hypothetical protein